MADQKSRTAAAMEKRQKAREQREIAADLAERGFDVEFEEWQAEGFDKEADKLLKPEGEIVSGHGEAIEVQAGGPTLSDIGLVDTLAHPDAVSLDASISRLELIRDAGVLEPALDAARAMKASTSLEKMLAHLLAGCHKRAMGLLKLSERGELPIVEVVRLTNAFARLMDTYQNGLLTFQKLRTGGKQTMVVQHGQVSDGGQAVVAGNVNTGGGSEPGEEVSKNVDDTP